eukprot:420683_1
MQLIYFLSILILTGLEVVKSKTYKVAGRHETGKGKDWLEITVDKKRLPPFRAGAEIIRQNALKHGVERMAYQGHNDIGKDDLVYAVFQQVDDSHVAIAKKKPEGIPVGTLAQELTSGGYQISKARMEDFGDFLARKEYINLVADYEYDAAVETAREEKAERLLQLEKKEILLAKRKIKRHH